MYQGREPASGTREDSTYDNLPMTIVPNMRYRSKNIIHVISYTRFIAVKQKFTEVYTMVKCSPESIFKSDLGECVILSENLKF